jgi:hypothetical protein
MRFYRLDPLPIRACGYGRREAPLKRRLNGMAMPKNLKAERGR